MTLTEKTQQLNHDLLGPIFYRFCYKLYLSKRCHPANDSKFLFLSRGGVRLRALYESFLNVNGLGSPVPYEDFYVSRMSLIKASLHHAYEEVVGDFLKEYAWFNADQTFRAFLQPDQYRQWQKCEHDYDLNEVLDRELIDRIVWGGSHASVYLRSILEEQHATYQQYLQQVLGARKHVLLVDTGWSGSILKFMQCLDPERDYTALYFGRYNYGKPDPIWFNRVVGVEVQHPGFDRKIPITSIFLNRHLIEGLCEIRWPSVTGYQVHTGGKVESYEGVPPESQVKPDGTEPHALGVFQYIEQADVGMNYEAINNKADDAARLLKKRLMYPSRSDLPLLSVPTRSADFGKDIDVPFLAEPIRPLYRLRAKLRQSKNALWQPGQLALEFGWLRIPAQFLYHRRITIIAILNKLGVVQFLSSGAFRGYFKH
jgi:hypothetical protein